MELFLYLILFIVVVTPIGCLVAFLYLEYITLLPMQTVKDAWKALFMIPFILYAVPNAPKGEGTEFQFCMFLLGVAMVCVIINLIVNNYTTWDYGEWFDDAKRGQERRDKKRDKKMEEKIKIDQEW